jgi:hypothetical protein
MSIDLIRAKQKELAEQEAAAIKLIEDRKTAAAKMFAETGIPAIWEQIKHVQVPQWRGRSSKERDGTVMIPLADHRKGASDVNISLTDFDGTTKICWYAETTDKGAVWLRVGGRLGRPGDSYTPDSLRDSFVEYMAKFLPPLENTNAKV